MKGIFSSSIVMLVVLSAVIVVLVETVGVWFLNNRLVVDEGREFAAFCVLQCSLVTFVLGLLSVPYNASIIAHERMSVFAFISILESVLKLGVVFIVGYTETDKLIVYAVCLLVVSLVVRVMYGLSGRVCSRQLDCYIAFMPVCAPGHVAPNAAF